MTTAGGTVFVVDDDAAVRRSLHRLFAAQGWAVESHATGAAFLAAYHPGRCGCLVLDLQLSGKSGIDVLDELAKRGATLPVIVLTAHGSVSASVRALKAGAVDFLEKPCPPGELTAHVRDALLLAEQRHRDHAARELLAERVARLTAREREVAALLMRGASSKAIATSLGISIRTAEGHRRRLLEKMQANSSTELVAMLLRAGGLQAA